MGVLSPAIARRAVVFQLYYEVHIVGVLSPATARRAATIGILDGNKAAKGKCITRNASDKEPFVRWYQGSSIFLFGK